MAVLCIPGVGLGVWLARREQRKAAKVAGILAISLMPSCKKEKEDKPVALLPKYECGPSLKAEYLYRVYYKGSLDSEFITYMQGGQIGDTYPMTMTFSYIREGQSIDIDCINHTFTVKGKDWGTGKIYGDDSLILETGDYRRVYLSRKERTNY